MGWVALAWASSAGRPKAAAPEETSPCAATASPDEPHAPYPPQQLLSVPEERPSLHTLTGRSAERIPLACWPGDSQTTVPGQEKDPAQGLNLRK